MLYELRPWLFILFAVVMLFVEPTGPVKAFAIMLILISGFVLFLRFNYRKKNSVKSKPKRRQSRY